VKKSGKGKDDAGGVSRPDERGGRRAKRQFIVVSYDIPSDRRRTKVCHLLKDYGQRVQYSVFECRLRSKDFKRLRERLRPLLDLAEDDVRFYRLCEVCLPKAKIWGPSPRQGVRESIVV
jgi:CRISPR-associated protein Cas2